MKQLFSLSLQLPALAVILMVFAISCKKTDKNTATVITSEIFDKTSNSAKGGGEVTDDGGTLVTERGVCWSVNETPTTADSKTTDGVGTGIFTSELQGLTFETVYYVRAYATNSAGTAYGSAVSFIAGSTGPGNGNFTDLRDGRVYRTQTIGIQTWMAENLAFLPAVSGSDTGSLFLPHYYVYGYDSTSVTAAKEHQFTYKDPLIDDTLKTNSFKTYGVLYNWPAAMVSCPAGWHLPVDADWKKLIETLESNEGGKMKETGTKLTDADTTHWLKPNTGATNLSGFTAIPGGERYSLGSDSTVVEKFRYINRSAVFWSSAIRDETNTWAWHLYFDNNRIDRDWFSNSNGFSVRCVKY